MFYWAKTSVTNQENGRQKAIFELKFSNKNIENQHCNSDFGQKSEKQTRKNVTLNRNLS